jgi:hypothetical protein
VSATKDEHLPKVRVQSAKRERYKRAWIAASKKRPDLYPSWAAWILAALDRQADKDLGPKADPPVLWD